MNQEIEIDKWNQGLQILARQNPLTDQEWLALVEARRRLLLEHLKDITLKQLGDVEFYSANTGGNFKLGSDSQILLYGGQGNVKYNLRTRGIFPESNGNVVAKTVYVHLEDNNPTNSTTYTWALTRCGAWIGIEIKCICILTPHPWKNRKMKSEKVVGVKISELSLEDICKFCDRSPQHIWKTLGDSVRTWTKRRQNLFDEAKDLLETFDAEEQILDTIPKK